MYSFEAMESFTSQAAESIVTLSW